MTTRNSALNWPPGTDTAPATCAAPLFELSSTIVPPSGVGAVSVSVPVIVRPPVCTVGFSVNEAMLSGADGAETTSAPVAVICEFEAVIWKMVSVVTDGPRSENVAVLSPAAIVTLAGSCSAGLSTLNSSTVLAVAGQANCTVAVTDIPDSALAG